MTSAKQTLSLRPPIFDHEKLDVYKVSDETDYVKGRELLDRIFAMLTKLAQGFSG